MYQKQGEVCIRTERVVIIQSKKGNKVKPFEVAKENLNNLDLPQNQKQVKIR